MNIKITDIKDTKLENVEVYLNSDAPYQETFFEWAASPLTAKFNSSEISGGVLTCWHHTYTFNEVEYHVDKEMFYFTQGTAIMLFVDQKAGAVDMSTAQMVRIPAGTQIIIGAGKAHFVSIAEDNTPLNIVVVSPKMDAPRYTLPETVTGIYL